MTSFKALQRRAREARHWLMDGCFPLWAEAGVHRSGVFIDALQLNHRASDWIETALVSTQARQTGLFAIAHGYGWQVDRALELCESGLERLGGPALREDGLPGTRIDVEGEQLTEPAPSRETALEILRAYGLIADLLPALAGRAETAASELRACLHKHGESQPQPDMAALEMRTELAWLEALPERYERAGLRRARESLLGAITDAPAWRVFDAVDMIWRAARLREDFDPETLAALFERACGEIGGDGGLAHGDTGERHALDHTLALRAHLAMMESGRDADTRTAAALCFDMLMDENLTFEGGWIARHGADGLPLDQDMPAGLAIDIAGAFTRLVEVVEA